MSKRQSILIIGILLIGVLVSSCSPSEQAISTATSVPSTETPLAASTPQPEQEPTEPSESFPVLTSWNDIPIFPDAISGKEDFGDYQFTTKSPARMIIAYYQQEMPKLGWEIRGDMMASTSSDLVFEKDNAFTFFLIKFDDENYNVFIHQVQN